MTSSILMTLREHCNHLTRSYLDAISHLMPSRTPFHSGCFEGKGIFVRYGILWAHSDLAAGLPLSAVEQVCLPAKRIEDEKKPLGRPNCFFCCSFFGFPPAISPTGDVGMRSDSCIPHPATQSAVAHDPKLTLLAQLLRSQASES